MISVGHMSASTLARSNRQQASTALAADFFDSIDQGQSFSHRSGRLTSMSALPSIPGMTVIGQKHLRLVPILL
jgi:hypothetical protein